MDKPVNPVNRPRFPLLLAPRRYPADLQLAWIYHNHAKTDVVDHRFHSCNFSFVLRGSGAYRVNDRQHRVEAPCVFIQQPETDYWYGPDDQWEEFSLLYSPDAAAALSRRGYLGGPPIWSIRYLSRIMPLIEELLRMQRCGELAENADRADRLADLVLCESLQQQPAPRLGEAQQKVRDLRRRLENDPAQPTDVAAWAVSCGLSESSFRRTWAGLCAQAPAAYQQHLRLREACRLLIETSLNIGEIAGAVGYEDPLYLSRIFHRKLGLTPTAYRRQQQRITWHILPSKEKTAG